jgi:hypothetical protein
MRHQARAEKIINHIVKQGLVLEKIEDILIVNFREVEARGKEPLQIENDRLKALLSKIDACLDEDQYPNLLKEIKEALK